MPDGQGAFDGDGSVRWEVVVDQDDDRKSESTPVDATGRKSKGVDKQHKTYFRVVFKVPEDAVQKQQFLSQFAGFVVSGNEVEVRLPILKTATQIKVKWDADGPIAGPRMTSI